MKNLILLLVVKVYVYMTKTSGGKFDVVAFDKPLDETQLANVLKTGALPKGAKEI